MNREIATWKSAAGIWRFSSDGRVAFEPAHAAGVALTDLRCRWMIRPLGDPWQGEVGSPHDDATVVTVRGDDEIAYLTPATDRGIEVLRVFRRREETVSAHLRIRTSGAATVWGVEWPVVEAESTDAGWYATVPYSTGYRLHPGRLHQGEEIGLNYPVHASMQWTAVCARGGSVYVGVHDRETWLKRLLFRRRAGALCVSVLWPDLALEPGSEWETPEIVLAPGSGDWREGAARYRSWSLETLRLARPPAWFFERPVWAWVGMKGQHADRADLAYADLPARADDLYRFGVELPQVAGWLEHGHDTHYPDYRAGPSLGGDAALQAASDRIHRLGRRFSLYTNGRLIDPQGSVGWRDNWQEMGVRLVPSAERDVFRMSGTFCDPAGWDPEGRMAKERYGDVTFAVGCPGSRAWRKLIVDRLASIVEAYAPDGLYIDQVAGCSSLPCYHPLHDHVRPGLAWSRYLSLLAELRLRVRAVRPDAYLATEGITDVFGQAFDAQQAHNDWRHQVLDRAEEMPELFRTTFPEILVLMGPVVAGDGTYVRLGHVFGAGLDCFPPDASDLPEFLSLLHGYADHRRDSLPWLSRNTPEPGVDADSGDVRVFGFRRPEGLCVHGARIRGQGAVRVILPDGPFSVRARVIDQDGHTAEAWVERVRDRRGVVVETPGMFRLVLARADGEG